jgi:redox-sensitive bicupin YhaK (pirin superfamily)
VIRPGDVNWMIAGRGIVHSERTSDAGNPPGAEMYGLQTWVALPYADEEIAPMFIHYGRDELPESDRDGVRVRIILGTVFGCRSPLHTHGDPVYAECRLEPDARLVLPSDIEERGAYIVSGTLCAAGQRFAPNTLVVFRAGTEIRMTADEHTRFMLVGGSHLDGPR